MIPAPVLTAIAIPHVLAFIGLGLGALVFGGESYWLYVTAGVPWAFGWFVAFWSVSL